MKKENFSSIAGCPMHGKMAPKISGLPLLGNLMDIRNRPLDVFIDGAAEHGSMFRFGVAGNNIHVVSGQTAIDLLKNDDETQLQRHGLFDAFTKEANFDIFSSVGEQHNLKRNQARLGYSRQVTAPFVPEMVRRLTKTIRSWPARIKALESVCFSTIEAVATALTPHELDLPLQKFVEFGNRVMMVAVRQRPPQIFHLPFHKKQKRQVHAALDAAIAAHRQGQHADQPESYILDALLNTEVDGEKIPDRDIRGMSIYALMGTHIYCGRTATFMIYELLKNPKLLEVVLTEVDSAFSDDGLEASLLRRMVYLRATFQEALRRYPLLPGSPFRAAKDLVIDGFQVPKDDILLLTGMPSHFLHKGYDNPWAFDAQRCLPPRNEHRDPAAFSPWGFKPRMCAAIGLNEIIIMTTVATILRTVRLELLRPTYEFQLVMRPLICPKDGLPLKVLGLRTESEYTADRSFLMDRQVDNDQLLDSAYEFELPELEPEEVPVGATVVEQGDPAEDFYIIVKGTADVLKTEVNDAKVVAQLSEGDSFGEIGLIKGVPRTATVKATSVLLLLRLKRDQFMQVVSDSDLLASEIGYLVQRRFVQKALLTTMPSLKLDKFSKLKSEFEIVYLQPGEVVFCEGDVADAMYIIVSGEFEVVKQTNDGEKVIRTAEVGELFGEIGVLQRQPRMATVRNAERGPGVLAKITRDKTESLLAESGQAHAELALLASKRLMETVEMLASE